MYHLNHNVLESKRDTINNYAETVDIKEDCPSQTEICGYPERICEYTRFGKIIICKINTYDFLFISSTDIYSSSELSF